MLESLNVCSLDSETLSHYSRPEILKSGQMLPCCSLKHFLSETQTSMPLKWIAKSRNSLKSSMYVLHVAETPMRSALSGPGVCLGFSCPACLLPSDGRVSSFWPSSEKPVYSLAPSATVWTQWCSFIFYLYLLWNIWLFITVYSFKCLMCIFLSPL